MTDEKKFDYKPFINYINNQDVFFVCDMLIYFNIKRTEPASIEEHYVRFVIKASCVHGHIQGCGKKGRNTQYITISKIPLTINIFSKNL